MTRSGRTKPLVLAMLAAAMVSSLDAVTAAQDEGDRPQRQRRQGRARVDKAPKVGDMAPLFTLKSLDGMSTTDLASFRDQRPVILFFGSYT
jgi:hypothetical protein